MRLRFSNIHLVPLPVRILFLGKIDEDYSHSIQMGPLDAYPVAQSGRAIYGKFDIRF